MRSSSQLIAKNVQYSTAKFINSPLIIHNLDEIISEETIPCPKSSAKTIEELNPVFKRHKSTEIKADPGAKIVFCSCFKIAKINSETPADIKEKNREIKSSIAVSPSCLESKDDVELNILFDYSDEEQVKKL
jgi:hypothetical protein